MNKIASFTTALLFISSSFLHAQSGCTDPDATNFNAAAKTNDGSCVYATVRNFPVVKGEMNAAIPESSGLVYTDGKLWTHNDSGNPNQIFSIDTATGALLQTVYIDNFTNTDWEDITADSLYIYVGDHGNNNGTRKDLKVIKVKKSDIGNASVVHVNGEAINFSYADQTSFVSSSSHNFDCESLMSIGDSLYLFTKDRGDLQTRVYKLSKKPGTYVISPYTSFNANGLVTGADYNPISKEVILIGYFSGHLNSFMWLFTDYKLDSFFTGNKRRITLGDGSEWQTEGIAFRKPGYYFISCESAGIYNNSTLFSNAKKEWSKAAATGLLNTKATIEVNCFPNPAEKSIFLESAQLITRVTILDQLGALILDQKVNEKELTLPLESLNFTAGMHLIQIQTAQGIATKKVLLVK